MFTSAFLHRFLAIYQSHAFMIVLLLVLTLALRGLPSWAVLLQRRRGSTRVDPRLHRKEALEWTYRLRYGILAIGGLSLAMALGGIAEAAGAWASSPHGAHLAAIALWLGAIVLMGLSLEEGIAPWFIPWFRDAAWSLARVVAPLRGRLRDLWLWAILALAAVSIAVRLLPFEGLSKSLDPWFLPTGAVLIGLALLRMAFQARRRIVIQPFAEPPGEDKLKGLGASLAIQLRHELARMQSLYETVDEVLPESQKGNLSLSMHVEDIGAIFKEAIGPDSKIAVGPVKIPIGAIVSALSLFVSGPRITGSLHREGNGLALLAEIGGGGQSGCWKVTLDDKAYIESTLREENETGDEGCASDQSGSSKVPQIEVKPALELGLGDEDRRVLDLLIRLLACRIFTSLVPIGSPRWQAVHHFTAGLHAYRETQRTERNKTVYLRKAERAFLRALSDDNNFVLCQCDLGVVYGELGMEIAEESALRQALAENPHAVDACLGLAVRSREKQRYHSAIRHCENALCVQADRPEIWHLLGAARAEGQAAQDQSSPNPQIVGSNRHCFEISTALAWHSLFRVSWSGRPTLIEKYRSLASFCLRELASELATTARTRRACRLFRQALRLGDDSSRIAFELGRTLFETQQWEEAEVALARIFNDGLNDKDRAALGLYLVGVQLALIQQERSEDREKKLLDGREFFLDQLAIGSWIPSDLDDPLTIIKDHLAPIDAKEASRLESLCKAVSLLCGMKRDWKEGDREYLPRLEAWKTTLEKLQAEGLHGKELDPDLLDALIPSWMEKGGHEGSWKKQLEALREERSDDWVWLYAQVLLNEAEAISENGELPAALIDRAVHILNALNHGLQIRKQGLYGKLADAYRGRVVTFGEAVPSREERAALLKQALIYAQKAVEWNPQGPRESFILGQVYAAMDDWPQATSEWERTLDLGPAPGTSKAIASTYFRELATRADRRAMPPGDPKRVHEFLYKALALVESDPLSSEDRFVTRGKSTLRSLASPVSRLEKPNPAQSGFPNGLLDKVEAHASLHFCLGRSYLAQKNYDEAVKHLAIARNLGFRPIETRIAIAEALLTRKQENDEVKARHELDEAKDLTVRLRLKKEKMRHLENIEEVRSLLPTGTAVAAPAQTPHAA